MKLLLVAGARPNFMKIAPIIRALENCKKNNSEYRLVHTGQHSDFNMSEIFFNDLGIPDPDYLLNTGKGSHSEQTAKIMIAFEKICLNENPDVVLVVGDVNSTLACSIVAKKLFIKVAHVEAGLRSFDLSMPEEINRMVTDSITDYFFTTEASAKENLIKEGKPADHIHFVGHVMVDNLLYQHDNLLKSDNSELEFAELKKRLGQYIFVTFHRPSNVDVKKKLMEIIGALNEIAKSTPVIFPVHPRTKKMLKKFNVKCSDNIILLSPLSFKNSLYLWKDALSVFTDSGGLQEETTVMGVPCFTIRDNTERPVTVKEGTNIIIGTSGDAIIKEYQKLRSGIKKRGSVPDLWDGKAAERIIDVLYK